MMDTVQRPVIVPKVKISIQRAARRKVLGDRTPLATRTQDVHQAVDHLTDVDAPFATTPFAWRDQGLNVTPFVIRNVARIAKLAAII